MTPDELRKLSDEATGPTPTAALLALADRLTAIATEKEPKK